ncbi:hypothetical protein DL98DRAFT_431969 [Cadophora sp. DSE1049]|nr:hypothetical protein DL98DRAFT_431969 [Cadophora sp. DSE1049]
MTFGIVLLGIFTYQSWRPARYERYPTPGSIGPKHQSRLLYNNATSWARQVGFDDTKWRIRIDDQALVPAHLYSTDEDRYQRWFRQRYPHLQEIIERHDYLRPSWLGSSQIAVPWDEQFHFAHCVLALRRYWVAKETGAHLCGRDIDYAHMKHCLDSLDEKAFPPGPMEDVGKGYRLWWQTKVCYD